MSKGRYSATEINHADVEQLQESFAERTLVLCTDVAKEDMFTAFADEDGQIEVILEWRNPTQLGTLEELVDQISPAQVVAVLESSGTYGEPLRELAFSQDWEVRLISTKRVHDARELYDGVPSMHDAKAATVIAKLHAEGLSQPWGPKGKEERRLRSAVKTMARREEQMQRLLGQLEGELARYWPELDALMEKQSATALALLKEFGGPKGIGEKPEEARRLMHKVGGHFLKTEKIEAVIESARHTNGQRMLEEECEMLAELAEDIDQLRQKVARSRKEVEAAGQKHEDAKQTSKVVGKRTGAILRDQLGDFRDYDSPEALIKAAGMILKETSSGKHQGKLRISKRGSATARKFLWWATLRLIQGDEVFWAWHQRKVERDAGLRKKSVVALMRKLLKGLWHVARGKEFDSTKLFDTTRLGLT